MSKKNATPVDFMAVGAHPDDMEILAGGTLLRLRALGRSGVLVDVTDGGAGTRGSAAIRAREAAAAARKLGVTRVQLGEPDGTVQNTLAAQWKLIAAIRRFRPRIMITHHALEEHPDHGNTAQLVREASFRAGLGKLDCEGEPWRPKRIFHGVGAGPQAPAFCVDISPYWEAKLRLIGCYESQIDNPKAGRYSGTTDLARPSFLEALEVRARFWGARIRRSHAEAFWCHEIAEVSDLTALGEERYPSTGPRRRP